MKPPPAPPTPTPTQEQASTTEMREGNGQLQVLVSCNLIHFDLHYMLCYGLTYYNIKYTSQKCASACMNQPIYYTNCVICMHEKYIRTNVCLN